MANYEIKSSDIKGADGCFTPSTTEELLAIGGILTFSTMQWKAIGERSLNVKMLSKEMDEEMLADRERILEEGLFSD